MKMISYSSLNIAPNLFKTTARHNPREGVLAFLTALLKNI